MSAPSKFRAWLPGWRSLTVAGLFAVPYLYAAWAAVATLVVSVIGLAESGAALSPTGWVAWILAIAFPELVFVGSFVLGRKRPAWQLALILLAGLCLVAVFWLDINAAARFSSGFVTM